MFDAEGKGQHGHDGIAAFWDAAIGNVERFQFTIRDSHAAGDEVANVGTITTYLPGGYRVDTDGVFVYRVRDAGLIVSMRAFWETERALAQLKEDAEAAYRAIARITRSPEGSLEALLGLPPVDELDVPVREDGLLAIIVLAALEAGTIRFEHRWEDDEPDFVRPDGSTVDFFEIVEDLLMRDPENVVRARAALAALGIDPTTANGGRERLSPRGSEVIGGLAHVKFDESLGHLRYEPRR